MLKVGEKAPDFTLMNQDGKEVSLSDFIGKKVILYFYPKDNTPGCTAEACSFRDAQPEYSEKDAVVLGISRDSVNSHKKFHENQNLNFDILSDKDLEVSELYNTWGDKNIFGKLTKGMLRTTFVIDENGIIEKVFEKVKPKDHANEVLKTI